MSKAELRKRFSLERKKASDRGVSATICKKALTLPEVLAAKTIMVYLSTNSELDTSLLIAKLMQSGKKICAPKVISDTEMEAAQIDSSGFQKGSFGIWEPKGKTVHSIDVIFVPGVAFDKKCNRLGYGKGYYDRFLRNHNAFTVGLAYSCQITEDIGAEPHDMKLDMILTENEVYRK